ncbi:hypothetical protein AgCh_013718 [Apium graveolens]
MENIILRCLDGAIRVRTDVASESSVIKQSMERGITDIQVPFNSDIMSKAMAFCEMKLDNESEDNLLQFIKDNKLIRLMDVAANLQIAKLIRMTTNEFDDGLFDNEPERKIKREEEFRKMVAKWV